MNTRGQSIIEYALIAVLVILGIVIMGPYALRSVNAHFKLWDIGVQDSFEETLNQAPVSVVPDIPLNCKCINIPGSCGSSFNGSQCGLNQRIINHTCPPPSPQGCDGEPASSCQNDPTCCGSSTALGCGTIPIGQPPTSNNCNYGQEIMSQQCGTNNSITCTANATCNAACQGQVTTVNGTPVATACPGATSGLTTDFPITYVTNKATCAGEPKCTYYCDTGYTFCNGVCTTLGTNSNCASCGDACTGNSTCQNGKCTASGCPAISYKAGLNTVTFQAAPNNSKPGSTCTSVTTVVTCSVTAHCSNNTWSNILGEVASFLPASETPVPWFFCGTATAQRAQCP